MTKRQHTLVLDVGTTTVKGLIFDEKDSLLHEKNLTFKKKAVQNRVEQDPNEYLSKAQEVLRGVIDKSGIDPISISDFGIATQRETFIVWDKNSGEPVYPAIVWEDSRTEQQCSQIPEDLKAKINQITGLKCEPYFTASKLAWLFENVINKSDTPHESLLFGTVETWIIWNWTKERLHLTDYTNASRTMLFDVHQLDWSRELLDKFNIPRQILPKAKPSYSSFGKIRDDVFGLGVEIRAVCGDQQASLFAIDDYKKAIKITYGTGTFIMQSLGGEFVLHKDFYTTLEAGTEKNNPKYVLEGKINCCAKKVEKVIGQPSEMNKIIKKLSERVSQEVAKLPQRPLLAIVDGGVTQAEDLPKIQQSFLNIEVRRQKIYNGTALGVVKLIHSI